MFKLVNAEDPMVFIVGKVISVDETNYTCEIQPDQDSIPNLRDVPLRVFALKDDFGFIVVPEDETPCLVGMIRGELPTFLKFQEWKKIIINRKDFFEMEIDAEGNLDLITKGKVNIEADGDIKAKTKGNFTGDIQGNCELKAQGKIQLGPTGIHKAAYGDMWLTAHNAHIHPTPTGPSGSPTPPVMDPQVNSQKVKLD